MTNRSKRWGGAVAGVAAIALTLAGLPAAAQPGALNNAPVGPQAADDEYNAGYLWTHFAIEGGYEKIFFGYSEDGLHWRKLNDNQPILANDDPEGDGGVRDPHLIRSPEGDKYWIIGTDLHAEGGGGGGSGWDQQNASQNLVVWESDDLVNWSDGEIIHAGFDHAGNVWAPEAIWNEETQ